MEWLTIKMPKFPEVFLVWLCLTSYSVRSIPFMNRVRVLDLPGEFPAEDAQVIQNLEFHLRLRRQVTDEKVTTSKPESLTKQDASPAPKETDDSIDASGLLGIIDSKGKPDDSSKTTKTLGESPGNLDGDTATNAELPPERTTPRTSLTSAAQLGDSLVTDNKHLSDAVPAEAEKKHSTTSAQPDLKPSGTAGLLRGLDNPSPAEATHGVTPSTTTTTTVPVTPAEENGAAPIEAPAVQGNKTETTTTTTVPVTPAEENGAAPIEAPAEQGNKTETTTTAPGGLGKEDMAPPPPVTTPSDSVTTQKAPVIALLKMEEESTNNASTAAATTVAMTTEKTLMKVLNASHFQMPPVAAPVEASVTEGRTTASVASESTTEMKSTEAVVPLASPAIETVQGDALNANKTELESTTVSEMTDDFVVDPINTTTSDSLSEVITASGVLGKTGSNTTTTTFQETNATVATAAENFNQSNVEIVTGALLESGSLPGTKENTTNKQNTTLTTVTNVTNATLEETENVTLAFSPVVVDVTNATTLQPTTNVNILVPHVFNNTNATTTQELLNVTVASVTELDMNITNTTNDTYITNATVATTELVNTTTAATQPITMKTTTLEPPTPNTTLTENRTMATATATKSTLQKITVIIPTTTTVAPTTAQNHSATQNHSVPVGQSQGLSASALTAIITGSIIGFWIILGPIICLICKVRDKRKERYHTRLTNHSDPPADNGMLDAMIISELKKTSESSHDNGTTGKEKEYNTVANDNGETDRLRSNTAEHEF